MYYCEYAHLLRKCTEHTCMSAIYYDQGSDIKAKQCKTIVTFDTIPESKILDAGNLLILSNLQKPWTIACARSFCSQFGGVGLFFCLYLTFGECCESVP